MGEMLKSSEGAIEELSLEEREEERLEDVNTLELRIGDAIKERAGLEPNDPKIAALNTFISGRRMELTVDKKVPEVEVDKFIEEMERKFPIKTTKSSPKSSLSRKIVENVLGITW